MIVKNNLLAIAIPTYNRAHILHENILIMLDEIRKFAIPIYISDDSNNNETEELLLQIKQIYPFIYYTKNKPALGHDKNFHKTIQIPTEEYIWYLGDGIIIESGGIERIYSQIENNHPDFISVNNKNRNLVIESSIYKDGNILLKDLGWHLTMTGATIYSRKMILENNTFEVLQYPNFPQIAFIFHCFASIDCNLYWNNDIYIYVNQNKKSYWKKDVFKVFITDWTNCITNLSFKYSKESKETAIISHSLLTGIFNLKSIISYRYKGFLGLKEYHQYFRMLKKHSKVNIYVIGIIVLIPRFILTIIIKIIKKLKNL